MRRETTMVASLEQKGSLIITAGALSLFRRSCVVPRAKYRLGRGQPTFGSSSRVKR